MEATAPQHFNLPKGEPAKFVRSGKLETCQCRDCRRLVMGGLAGALSEGMMTMTERLSHDDQMRLLGARDGFASALVKLRMGYIGPLVGPCSPRIDPRHVKKLAAREARLKPLRELEAWLLEQHKACMNKYRQDAISAEQSKGTQDE